MTQIAAGTVAEQQVTEKFPGAALFKRDRLYQVEDTGVEDPQKRILGSGSTSAIAWKTAASKLR